LELICGLQTSGISVDDLMEHLFILRDQDATQHLFRVASGLDSLVLGEGQILAQVRHLNQDSAMDVIWFEKLLMD